MKPVFISYSRQDTPAMLRIAEWLQRRNIPVWKNEQLIPGTADWKTSIEQAIAGATAVVALLSPQAKSSEWVI